MDFLTKKEIEGLKQDIQAKDIAVEADKYAFEAKLLFYGKILRYAA